MGEAQPVPSGGLTRIETKLLAAPAASFDFQSIPATFTNLLIVWQGADSGAAAAETIVGLRMNNDAGANYSEEDGSARGAAAGAFSSTGDDRIRVGVGATNISDGISCGEIWIPNYLDTTFFQTVNWQSFASVPTVTFRSDQGGGLWSSKVAVTRLTMLTSNNWVTASRATLYGL